MFIVNFITQTLCTIYLCFHIYETSCKHVKVAFLINYRINYYGNYFIISIRSTKTIRISSCSSNNTNIWHLCWNNSFLVIWLSPPEKFWLDLSSSWYIYQIENVDKISNLILRGRIRDISWFITVGSCGSDIMSVFTPVWCIPILQKL